MHTVTLLIELAEALVFAVAGGMKVWSPSSARAAVRTVGTPSPLVPVVAVALPLAELGVALALVVGPTRWGALAALFTTALFDLVIAGRALRGDLGLCHCFGRWSGTISVWTIVRNFALALGAAYLLWSAVH